MRFSLVALVGLAAFTGKFTANAKALPNDLSLSSSFLTVRDSEPFAVEKQKRAVGLSNAPRAVGGPPAPPKPVTPKPVTPPTVPETGSPGENGVKPGVDNPVEPTNEDAGLDNPTIPPEIIDAQPVEPFGQSTDPPLDIKPATPKTGADRPNPNTAPKPDSLGGAIDFDPADDDPADTFPTHKVCRLSKRDRLPSPWNAALAIHKRSGDKGAVNWDTWKALFTQINEALRNDPRITRQISIYVMGGVTGLSLNSRGPNGKTADTDVIHDPSTTDEEKAAFDDAVAGVYDANRDLINDDFFNTAVSEFFNSDQINEIVMNSNEAAWSDGDKLKIVNGWYGVQLANKMDRMTNANAENRAPQTKDLQDATAVLKRMVANNNGEKITLNQFNEYSKFIGKDPEELIAAFGRTVANTYDGFAQTIMDRVVFYEERLKALEGSDSDEC